MKALPYTRDAYRLLHEGCEALAQVERAGFRVNVAYLDKTIRKLKRKISRRQERLEQSEVTRVWKKTYRSKYNATSPDQLGKVLFDVMGLPAPETTESGRYKTDMKSLSAVDHPFIRAFLRIRKDRTTLNTFLKGLRREVVDGFVHPFFNLHTVRTYRGSCNDPNGQNFPIRDEQQSKLVRTAIIPRKGRRLVEHDFKGLEVSIAACYHKDPAMITYLEDSTKDLHRDMAAECFMLPIDEVTKVTRYCGKNMFVFPQFYGDWYLDCAKSMWEAISEMKLETVSGVPMREHLRSKGIKSRGRLEAGERPKLGSFERHISKVEKRFWKDKFPVYAEWKEDWLKKYKKLGYMKTLTGFICQGFMKKNEIINYPVQGSAFHCLLQCLIWLIKEELRKRKMKTEIVLQIHDSLLADVPVNEYDDYLAIVHHVMTKRLKEVWKWICVPLSVDAEACEVGGSWADKKEIELPTVTKADFRSMIPGTPSWMVYWKSHSEDQEDMLVYQRRWLRDLKKDIRTERKTHG